MPIRTEKHIIRQMLQDNPSWYFVFGDNLQRKGLGGQAAEMRGEPNAVGIPTKREPSMHPVAFFNDRDLGAYRDARAGDLTRLVQHLRNGGTVVLPADGLGTGRARLQQTAPKVWAQLQEDLHALRETAAGAFAEGYDGHDRRVQALAGGRCTARARMDPSESLEGFPRRLRPQP